MTDTIQVAIAFRDGGVSKMHSLQFYSPHVREKALVLLAARDEYGNADIPGVGYAQQFITKNTEAPRKVTLVYVHTQKERARGY